MRDTPDSRVKSTLRGLAKANQTRTSGAGLQPDQYILLCKYHSRSVARKLVLRLQENDIRTKTKTKRMDVSVFVMCKDREQAFRLLEEFAKCHVDTERRPVSRDYDAAFLIGFPTIIVAVASFFSPALTPLTPIAVLTSGISLCIVFERWHRQYRYQEGDRFALREVFGLTALFAVNFAIWRFVVL